jgi:hypothetical protein
MWEPYLKVNGEEPIMRRKVPGISRDQVTATISSP